MVPAEWTDEELREVFTACIKPNAAVIAKITMEQGDVALVVYKPDADWCEALDIPAETPTGVAHMDGSLCRRLSEHSDRVTARWLSSKRSGRAFLVSRMGSVLLNFSDGRWSVEPDSADADGLRSKLFLRESRVLTNASTPLEAR